MQMHVAVCIRVLGRALVMVLNRPDIPSEKVPSLSASFCVSTVIEKAQMKVYSEFPCPSIENIFLEAPEAVSNPVSNANLFFVPSEKELMNECHSPTPETMHANMLKYWGNTQFTWADDVISKRTFCSNADTGSSPGKRKFSEDSAHSFEEPWSEARTCDFHNDNLAGVSPQESELLQKLVHYSTSTDLAMKDRDDSVEYYGGYYGAGYGHNDSTPSLPYPDIDPCFRLKDMEENEAGDCLYDQMNGDALGDSDPHTVAGYYDQALSTFDISHSPSGVSQDTEEFSLGETSASEASLPVVPTRSSSAADIGYLRDRANLGQPFVYAPEADSNLFFSDQQAFQPRFHPLQNVAGDATGEFRQKTETSSPRVKANKGPKFDPSRAPFHIRKVLSAYPPDDIPPPDKFMLQPWAVKSEPRPRAAGAPKSKHVLSGLPSAGLTARERLDRFRQEQGEDAVELSEDIECSHCNTKFDDLENYMTHLDAYSITHENFCPDESCVYSAIGFRFRWSLRRHICNCHLKDYNNSRDKALSVETCAGANAEIEKHLSHVYVCKKDNCLRAFYRSDSLRRHQKLIHEHGSPSAPKKKKKRKLKLTSCDRDQFI